MGHMSSSDIDSNKISTNQPNTNSKELDSGEKYHITSNKDNSIKSDISVFAETRPTAQPITSPLQENRSLSVLSSENDLEYSISAKETSPKDRGETAKSSIRR